MTPSSDEIGAPLWDGRPGRVEVWYATFTDPESGTGYWLHYETVAPTGSQEPYAHGWAAVFAPEGEPLCERFGPDPVGGNQPGDNRPGGNRPDDGRSGDWLTLSNAVVGPGRLRGATNTLSWDLTFDDSSDPLFTFGRRVWDRHILPGAQCVPWPMAQFHGTLSVAGVQRAIQARGALARIYGHSNAERWCWLHADLGDGGALELVSATARRRSLRRLPPLAMVQLRLPGEADWPRVPVLAAPLLRTRIGESGFTVAGRVGRRRLRIEVAIPPERSVRLGYTDPDGCTATCTNSEVADARIVLAASDRTHNWDLRGGAHAEIGRRP